MAQQILLDRLAPDHDRRAAVERLLAADLKLSDGHSTTSAVMSQQCEQVAVFMCLCCCVRAPLPPNPPLHGRRTQHYVMATATGSRDRDCDSPSRRSR